MLSPPGDPVARPSPRLGARRSEAAIVCWGHIGRNEPCPCGSGKSTGIATAVHGLTCKGLAPLWRTGHGAPGFVRIRRYGRP
ncbi:SEC-C metal-binding domain-containing protein [uncultured Enterovirga sp.]|uniref:SEC-C metal-binding domain-containing protein n=1 Tax=uncultured Enterovirga sp. TaxID=2026352 RepID=UPI0035CC0984